MSGKRIPINLDKHEQCHSLEVRWKSTTPNTSRSPCANAEFPPPIDKPDLSSNTITSQGIASRISSPSYSVGRSVGSVGQDGIRQCQQVANTKIESSPSLHLHAFPARSTSLGTVKDERKPNRELGKYGIYDGRVLDIRKAIWVWGNMAAYTMELGYDETLLPRWDHDGPGRGAYGMSAVGGGP